MKQNLKDIIDKQGWIEITDIHSDNKLLDIANQLGEVIAHPNGEVISNISPKAKEASMNGTFSNRFGFEEFPLHTDTAFWSKPVRFVLLSSENVSQTKTLILHKNKIWERLNESDQVTAKQAVYIVKTIHGQHYASLLFNDSGNSGLRYDPCTMYPVNKAAKEIHQKINEILKDLSPYEIEWSGNKVIIFDNWSTLHGRSNANSKENRILKRIYIN
ncbi:MAG: TauD/TfdA family dioxygenase [Saprospiraceae bacterium]